MSAEQIIGYVVVEFNQASGQPELSPFSFLEGHKAEAEERRDLLKRENQKVGRHERYAVATLTIEDDE